MIDNIVIGEPLVSLESLGVLPDENTVHLPFHDIENEGEVFLPGVLAHVGLFKSTSQIRQINKQRMKSDKIKDPLSQNLWRTITKPEMTHFKVGKKVFWLIVGK